MQNHHDNINHLELTWWGQCHGSIQRNCFVMQYQCPIILKCYWSYRESGILYRICGILLSPCVWRGMGVHGWRQKWWHLPGVISLSFQTSVPWVPPIQQPVLKTRAGKAEPEKIILDNNFLQSPALTGKGLWKHLLSCSLPWVLTVQPQLQGCHEELGAGEMD